LAACPPAPAVLLILHQSVAEPVDPLTDMWIFKFTDDFPIQLTTSIDLKKSDPLFDSDFWLWQIESSRLPDAFVHRK
jgi:hypothetical protein